MRKCTLDNVIAVDTPPPVARSFLQMVSTEPYFACDEVVACVFHILQTLQSERGTRLIRHTLDFDE